VAALRAARQRVDAAGSASGLGDEPGSAQDAEQRELFELASPRHRVVEVGIRLSNAQNVSQVLYFRDVTHETEVDRMKSEFLTTAAHELRTPMTSIYGFVNLLRVRKFDEERRKDILSTIAQQSELMIAIINQLLDLARIESRRGQDFLVERLTLQELVDTVVAGYQVPAGRGAPQRDGPSPALCIQGDRQKLQQALLNILANAYKYSPGGGAVEIDFVVDARGTPDDGARVGVRLRDHGIGMTAEQRSHVCERFYRADASGAIPGTGLGMSIVKEIVELHGGQIEIDSAPGAGTAVTLWFPAARTTSTPTL
jgi:signal transduction histidine kinase